MAEYAFVLVLVSIVAITLLLAISGWLSNVFSSMTNGLSP